MNASTSREKDHVLCRYERLGLFGRKLHRPEPLVDGPAAAMGAYDPYMPVPELGKQSAFPRSDFDDVRLADLPNAVPVPFPVVELVTLPEKPCLQAAHRKMVFLLGFGVQERLQRLPDIIIIGIFEVLDFLVFHASE